MNKRPLLLIFLLLTNIFFITPAQALKISVEYKWPVAQIIAGIALLPFLTIPIKNKPWGIPCGLLLGTSRIFLNYSEEHPGSPIPVNLLPTIAGITLIGHGIRQLIT